MKYKFLLLYNFVSMQLFDLIVKKNAKQFEVSGYKLNSRPQEDSFSSSKRFPIFCVCDGVTLESKPGKKYPNPSGAFLVADKFVKSAIKESEKNYHNFSLKTLKNIFKKGNQTIKKINNKYSRIKGRLNYLDFDLFCATSGFGLIKDRKLYWFTIADSFITIFDKKGKQKFISPAGWRFMQIPKNLEGAERKIYIRKYLRNGFKNNKKIGYGVINGEQKAIKYLDYGIKKLDGGDLIFIGTDGYEKHIKLKNFINLFVNWKSSKVQITRLEKNIIKKSSVKYGQERTMFVVKYQK